MRGVLASGAVVMVLAGCGGGGMKTVTQVRTQTSAAPLTKAQYIAQADAICRQYLGTRHELRKEFSQFPANPTASQAHQGADLLRKAVMELQPEVQALQTLPRPPADATFLGHLFDLQGAAITNVSNMADAIDAMDVGQIRTLAAEVQQNGAEARGIAQGYGFQVCGRVQ